MKVGPVHDKEKESWRILINKEIYAMVKQPTIAETIRLNRLCWFGHARTMEGNIIPPKVLNMNLETTRMRGDGEIDSKTKEGRMEDQLVELGGGKEYTTERNGRSS